MYLEHLTYNPEPITAEQYRLWRNNPCTRELKHALAVAFIEQIDDPLPESIDRSLPLAHQREGAKKTLDLVFAWFPDSLEDEDLEN